MGELVKLRESLIDSITKDTTDDDLLITISGLQSSLQQSSLQLEPKEDLFFVGKLKTSDGDDSVIFNRKILKKAVDVKNTEVIQRLFRLFSSRAINKANYEFYFNGLEEERTQGERISFTPEDKVFVLIHIDENNFINLGYNYTDTLTDLINNEILKLKDGPDSKKIYLTELLFYILNSFSELQRNVLNKLSFRVIIDIIENKFEMEEDINSKFKDINSKFKKKYGKNIDDFILVSPKILTRNKRPLMKFFTEKLSDGSDGGPGADKSGETATNTTNGAPPPPPDASATDATNANETAAPASADTPATDAPASAASTDTPAAPTDTTAGGKKKRNNKTKKRKKTRKKKKTIKWKKTIKRKKAKKKTKKRR